MDRRQADDWWQASDGMWYPPESLHPASFMYTGSRRAILKAAIGGATLIAAAWVIFLIAMRFAGGYVELLTYDEGLALVSMPIGLLGLVLVHIAHPRMGARIKVRRLTYAALAAGYVGAGAMAVLILLGAMSASS